MLTRAQFASIAGANEKWVENVSRTLGRRFTYSIPEARWLGLLHRFALDLRISLLVAAEMADRAVAAPVETREAKIAASSRGVAVVVDLARYHSDFAVAVASALHNGLPKASGRPVRPKPRTAAQILQAAKARGVDLSLLKAGLERTPAERLRRLDENTAFIRAIRPVGQSKAPTRTLVPLFEVAPVSDATLSVSRSSGAEGRLIRPRMEQPT